MQRCLHCQFPVAHKAKLCGWCGAKVGGGLPTLWHWPTQRHTQTPNGQAASAVAPSSLIGIPGMSPLVTDLPGNSATTMPASPLPGGALNSPNPASPYATGPLVGEWPGTRTFQASTATMTSALPYTPAPPQTPPPPQIVASTGVDRWWQVGLLLLPLLTWMLISNDQYWTDALQTTTRMCFMSGAVMSGWLLYRRYALGHEWHTILIPAVTGLLLVVIGGLSSAFVQPAAIWQGQQSEQRGDYSQAIAIYDHAGDGTDAARAQIAWGNKLIDQNNYAAATQHLNAGLVNAVGPLRDEGHVALGRLYWQWGQMSLQAGKIADARAEWTLATVQAAGTPAGDQAAAALAAPQNVTGHVIWLGQPMPALRVALISNWAYSSSTRSLQSSGDRLEATTGNDGTFTITGAKPGVTYALIWVGTFGDTTRVDAHGNPTYTIKAHSLESTNIGTIDIGTSPAPSSGNDQS